MVNPETNGVEFHIRPATMADVVDLGRFIEPFVQQKRLLPRTHDELADLTKDGFLAISQEKIVGFAALEIYSSKLGEIRSLAVDGSYHGQGIGSALVKACVDRARGKGIYEVMAITSADDFFRKCGFDFSLPGERKALFLQTREDY